MTPRVIVFVTGTRADFGKLKSLMTTLESDPDFEVNVFVTGSHLLSRYGSTYREVEKCGFSRVHKYINQNQFDSLDQILAKTVSGFSDYVLETKPDMIVVHGDRSETLAAAIVGAFNNILVAHVEGGEVSGTIDELLRHAVTKMSHLHFVANDRARSRVIQLGELPESVFTIGSPERDIMTSGRLPTLDQVKQRYGITFSDFGLLLFHPVTTERAQLAHQTEELVAAVLDSGHHFVVIYPNNDPGSEIVLDGYRAFDGSPHFRVFPSMRFEYFLSLMKHAQFMVGNSSAGVREAPLLGVPSVNVGTRQHRRSESPSIVHAAPVRQSIVEAIEIAAAMGQQIPSQEFGDGGADERFKEILKGADCWAIKPQKQFVDIG